MARRLLSRISLVGLLVSAGLWGASYYNLIIDFNSSTRWLDFSHGGIWYFWISNPTLPDQPDRDRISLRAEGFNSFHTEWAPGIRNISIANFFMPLWIPCLLFGSIFILCVVAPRARMQIRTRLGLCISCGYDLRGSTERCPECGTGFEKK